MTRALARRYGGGVRGAKVVRGSVRSLAEVAIENAVEGCEREAFGALVATWQAQAALRAALGLPTGDQSRVLARRMRALS